MPTLRGFVYCLWNHLGLLWSLRKCIQRHKKRNPLTGVNYMEVDSSSMTGEWRASLDIPLVHYWIELQWMGLVIRQKPWTQEEEYLSHDYYAPKMRWAPLVGDELFKQRPYETLQGLATWIRPGRPVRGLPTLKCYGSGDWCLTI